MDEETSTKDSKSQRRCLDHSWFEWLSLISSLFVPLVVGVLSIVLPLQQQNLSERQNENSKSIAYNSRLQDLELLRDQQRQIILNTYEHDLSESLLNYEFPVQCLNDTNSDDCQTDVEDERISFVLRMKTLHAIRQLDPARKILLIHLLIDSGIQNRINLSRADLSSLVFPPGSQYNHLQFAHVVARNLSLKRVSLLQSNFSYSVLDDSSFYQSNCSLSDFSHASLQRTDWTNADVSQAVFNYSNLNGAKISQHQLVTMKSLQGAILPNGSTATT